MRSSVCLGSDIQMQLDECVALPGEWDALDKAVELSLRWAERCRVTFAAQRAAGAVNEGQGLFAIVQGGTDRGLRRRSAEALVQMDFSGYAVGGLAVGEGHQLMVSTLEETLPFLPVGRPRYLMGVGTPEDIIASVVRGIDMFDCVMPTRAGRHGLAFTWNGGSTCAMPGMVTMPVRWMRLAAVRRRGIIRGPICITCSRRVSIWGDAAELG